MTDGRLPVIVTDGGEPKQTDGSETKCTPGSGRDAKYSIRRFDYVLGTPSPGATRHPYRGEGIVKNYVGQETKSRGSKSRNVSERK